MKLIYKTILGFLKSIDKFFDQYMNEKGLILKAGNTDFVLKKPEKCRILFLVFLILSGISTISAQNEMFLKREFISQSDTLRYRILFPENYDLKKTYPLVIFLHGSGERGADNEKQLKHGAVLFTDKENRAKYPSIVLFPQCREKEYWAPIVTRENGFGYPLKSEATEPMQLLIRLIAEIRKNEAVDQKRIYIMGLSMGGMGTFDLICRKPGIFAAAIPICGGVNIDRLNKVKDMPVRIYHGADDPVVSPAHSVDAYNKLKTIGSKQAELIIYPGVGHNSWTNAFAADDFMSWIYKQHK